MDPDDLVWAHATAMDLCARGLLVAETMIREQALQQQLDQRYAGWDGKLGKGILAGKRTLAELADMVETNGLDPKPRSGRQERLEALVNGYF